MRQVILSFFIVFFVLGKTNAYSSELAWVSVPVLDAVHCSLQEFCVDSTCEKFYCQLPIAREKGHYACPRSHQLLFNELVKIVEEINDEVKCELLNVFYKKKNNERCSYIWVLKKNIYRLKELKKKKIDLSVIPAPYTNNRKKSLTNILTLLWPWYDPITKQKYSAGTRFVRASKFDRPNIHAIYILEPDTFKRKITYVPCELAIVKYPKNKDEAKELFLEIVKKWANQSNFIPYVWGGCSFCETCEKNEFELITDTRLGKPVTYWSRKQIETAQISGIECSALIFRIAQIVGMPYFYRNSATLAQHLDSLKSNESLSSGDLIWYPGHVLIVSNFDQNKVIESAGYRLGFGKVHELSLDRVFKDIRTFSDLSNAFRLSKPIYRIDNRGQKLKLLDKFLLLKLDSIWQKN